MTAFARWLALLSVTGVLCAQETPPIPSARPERPWQGSIDVRNRFVQDIGGSQDVYRSVVNLGEGPRLFGGDIRFRDPQNPYADEMTFGGTAWGGDPFNTFRADIKRRDLYKLSINYRSVAYFNNLPSFANPLLSEGLLLSQRALDIRRRQIETELTVKPNSPVSPFFSFYNAEGFGRGVTTFVTDGNEFPVSTDLDDNLASFRGGVKLNFSKINFTLEQGATTFSDDQEVFFDDGGNRGNRRTRLFGREVILDELDQRYRADGDGLFNRGVVQGRPWRWLHFTGQFLYSQPEIDVSQELNASGEFFSLGLLSPFSGVFEQNLADANRPHSSGSWTTEVQAHPKLRIVQSWYTDRFHVSSGSTLTQMLNTDPETLQEQVSVNSLIFNYSQHQVDAIYQLHPRVRLRGGHRFVWGDAEVPPTSLQLGGPRNQGEIRRHVGLGGANIRASRKLRVTADFEASPGDETFFRTGLMDYERGKFRARYRLSPEWSLSGAFTFLNNRNSDPDIGFDFESRQTSLTLHWTPEGGRVSVLADYTRATVESDIQTLALPFFGTQFSRFRDNGHHGSAFAEIRLPRNIRLTAGGSLSVNSGSRPTDFYQPQVTIVVPTVNRIKVVTEWRWYGFDEQFFRHENFRTHTFSTGLQFGL